jgi:hypothetical protein
MKNEIGLITNYVENYSSDHINVSLGVRHTSIKSSNISGIVFNSVTKTPLPNATVAIVGTQRTIKTDTHSKFSFLFRKSGIYSFHEGYKTYTGDPILIKPGDLINIKIELETNE